ncbi:unnamed protein product [Arabidopsis halleri]
MNRLIFFMLVTATYYGVNEACKENKIVIRNRLGPGEILKYHCRSKKIDLGVLYLDYNATRIITLKDEGINITKWNCLFKHGPPHMQFYSEIPVYSQNTLAPQCDQLRAWFFRRSVILFTNDYNNPAGPKYRWSRS